MSFSGILERFGKLPRTQRLLLFAVTYIIVGALFYILLFGPKTTELSSLKAERVSLAQQKTQVEERVRNKAQFDAELQQLMADLKQALKELPNDREIPGLLKGISSLGKKVGLDVRKFQPLPEVRREFVAEVPVALEVDGSFHEVAMFFDRLSKMNRIVYIQNVNMSKPTERGGKVYLTVSGKAVTFRFLSEQEIKSNAEVDQDKRRGKRKGK